MSDVKKAAAEYSGCTLVGLNPLGQEMWQSKSLFLLGQREMKTEAFIAGAAWQREVDAKLVDGYQQFWCEDHMATEPPISPTHIADAIRATAFDDTKEKP